uniref:Uncharacterized protein n=1 Tax=Molossus molossus TaxID=27622 RepID=A0A7J8JXK3_MOLMO|nr:hypothetical protein HJG59_008089 [Molossus molossus]
MRNANAYSVSGDFGAQEFQRWLPCCHVSMVLPDLSESHFVKCPHFPRTLKFTNKTCRGPPADLLGSSPGTGSHIRLFKVLHGDYAQATVQLSLSTPCPALTHPRPPPSSFLLALTLPSGEVSFLFAFCS